MTSLSAKVNFIRDDIWISDLDNPAWSAADVLPIDKAWSGELANRGRCTAVRLLWSSTALFVRFDAHQAEPLYVNEHPQVAAKTMQLWEHDVCELFLASDPDDPRRYAEFEIAPTGEWLDLMVDWTKDEPRDWEYISGMEPFAKIEPGTVVMAMKIPWTAFGKKPEAGDVWLGNLFRQVGSGETRGYLAWSPTMTPEAQFHVPEKFGEFIFVD